MTTPKTITDAKLFPAALVAWNELLANWGAKAAASFRMLGQQVADALDMHEDSLNRDAVAKLISTQASQVRGAQKRALAAMPKTNGSMPNPDAIVDDNGTTVAQKIERKLYAVQKAKVHELLATTENVRVQLNRTGPETTDADGTKVPGKPLAPIALDLTTVDGIDDEQNTKLNNVYAAFMPSTSNTVKTSKEEAAGGWTI